MSGESLEFVSRSPDETLAFGEALGRLLRPGDVVALRGELGAGKTLLTKGIARGIGADPAEVTSPTFVLMHVYEGRIRLAHFDAYRLRGAAEMIDLGAEEAFYEGGASVVEWADRVEEALPPERLDVSIEVVGETQRRMALRARGERAGEIVKGIVSIADCRLRIADWAGEE